MCFSTFLPLCWHVLWPVNWSLVQAWAFYQLWKQDGGGGGGGVCALKVFCFLCTAGGTDRCCTCPSHVTSSLLKAEVHLKKRKWPLTTISLTFVITLHLPTCKFKMIDRYRQTDWRFRLVILCIVSSAEINGHDVLMLLNSTDVYPMETYCPRSVEKMRLRWATRALQHRGGTVEAETWPPALL